MPRATILFAHGSRDPLWSQPIEAVAQHMRTVDPSSRVQCAYLEAMQPDLETAMHASVADGCDEIVVVPMFLGVGRHARDDLPALVVQLQRAYPGIAIRLRPAIGEDMRVVHLLAQVALG